MTRLFFCLGLASMLMFGGLPAQAQELTITIKDHKFSPAELKVPAKKRITLTVVNDDPTPEEFESKKLKVEKVIPGKTKDKLKGLGSLTCIYVTDSHPNAVAQADDFLVVNSIASLLTDAVLKSRAELV